MSEYLGQQFERKSLNRIRHRGERIQALNLRLGPGQPKPSRAQRAPEEIDGVFRILALSGYSYCPMDTWRTEGTQLRESVGLGDFDVTKQRINHYPFIFVEPPGV